MAVASQNNLQYYSYSHQNLKHIYEFDTLAALLGLLRYFLQQSSEQNHRSPLVELEYRTPSARSLNSLLHELQSTYIIYHINSNNICYKAICIERCQ
jgi:hypothetical protein